MVIEQVRELLQTQYGCQDMEVEMSSTLDDLNLSDADRSDLSVTLEEIYGVEIPTAAVESFETIEDIVGYVEDHMGSLE